MSRPGDRLRALAARVFDARTLERVVDPVVADLQAEHRDAIHAGRLWRSYWVRMAGYMAFVKVAGVCGWDGLIDARRDWTAEDRTALARVMVFSVVPVAAITLLLELSPLTFWLHSRSVTNGRLLLYLMPQAMTVAVPVGGTLGILFGLRGRAFSPRLRGVLVALALGCSAASFGNLGWILPGANQAFRVAIYGRADLARGANELSLGELSRRMELSGHGAPAGFPGDPRNLAFSYHYRWAFSCAPLILALLGLAIVARRSFGRLTMGVAAFSVFSSYYVLLFGGRALALTGVVPAYAGAWLPNVCIGLVSTAFTIWSRRVELAR